MRILVLAFFMAAALLVAPTRASAQQVVECSSIDGTLSHCEVDASGRAYLQRQHSRAPCIENSTWGYDRHGIWVSDGCRAEFLVGRPRQSKVAERNAAIAAAALLTTVWVIAAKHQNEVRSPDDAPLDSNTFEQGCMAARASEPQPESVGEDFTRGYAACMNAK